MVSIIRATNNDIASIVNIGSVSVTEAHKESCSAVILSEYIHKNYNYEAIQKELEDEDNIYHIIHYDDKPVGFSKIVLNAKYGNIQNEHVAKLDRIYLLKPYHGFKLGYELLKFNCAFSKKIIKQAFGYLLGLEIQGPLTFTTEWASVLLEITIFM